jgi:hypothetical protein
MSIFKTLSTIQQKNVEDVTEKTINFIEESELNQEFEKNHGAMSLVFGLIPSTSENLFSGNLFPYFECQYEFESSAYFLQSGFYKQAIISLRSALELGILSVYWDIDGRSHEVIQKWLHSEQNTPYKSKVEKIIFLNKNIKQYNLEFGLFKQLNDLFSDLSNFVHTKGVGFSSRKFVPVVGKVSFSEKAVRFWFEKYSSVVRAIVTLHLLRYPVGVIALPLSDKFGIDPPGAGFLESGQVEILKLLFSDREWKVLEEISTNDEDAISIREWFKSLPNMTAQDFENQILEQNKQMILHHPGGFEGWKKQEQTNAEIYYGIDSDFYKQTIKRILVLKKWTNTKEYKDFRTDFEKVISEAKKATTPTR